MSNGKDGILIDIGDILKDNIKVKQPLLQDLEKISTDPTKLVYRIFYDYEEKDEKGQTMKQPGLLSINCNLSGNPLSGDDTFSILDPFTMTLSVPIGYLIGIAEERMKETDLYGAAVAMSGIKDFISPLSDYISLIALRGILEDGKPKEEKEPKKLPPELLPYVALLEILKERKKEESEEKATERESYPKELENIMKEISSSTQYRSESLKKLYEEISKPSYRIKITKDNKEQPYTSFSDYF